jgi:hypothetical protein
MAKSSNCGRARYSNGSSGVGTGDGQPVTIVVAKPTLKDKLDKKAGGISGEEP